MIFLCEYNIRRPGSESITTRYSPWQSDHDRYNAIARIIRNHARFHEYTSFTNEINKKSKISMPLYFTTDDDDFVLRYIVRIRKNHHHVKMHVLDGMEQLNQALADYERNNPYPVTIFSGPNTHID